MTSNLTCFFYAIFTHGYRAYTGARFLQSHATKKEGQILIFFGCLDTTFFAVSGCHFESIFEDFSQPLVLAQ